MSTTNDALRRRPVAPPTDTTTSAPTSSQPANTPKKPSPSKSSPTYILLETLRALTGLTLLALLTSYLLTSGHSLTFGLNTSGPSPLPTWASPSYLLRQLRGPVTLTPQVLALHNGTAAHLPIYLSLNRTIYDVSRSPHIYGPGGMYSFFAGRDASRAFVTGCFSPEADLVPWLEGVEEIYVPLWLSSATGEGIREEWEEVLAGTGGAGGVAKGRGADELIEDVRRRLGPEKVGRMREEAYKAGRERVAATLANWANMLSGKGYPVVGTLVDVDTPASAAKAMDLPICKDALKNRPGMTESLTQAMAALVKEGKLDIKQMAREYAAAEGKDVGADGMVGADPKAREAIKEQVQRGHAHAQKQREASPQGHGQGGLPPHGGLAGGNPHAAGKPHAHAAGGNPHAHAAGSNPHSNPHANPHAHHGAQAPLGHNPHAAMNGMPADHAHLQTGGAAGGAEAANPHHG